MVFLKRGFIANLESLTAHEKRIVKAILFLYLENFTNMYYCYILYSAKIDKYYIGSTGDLEGRLQRHNKSNHGFTSTGKPWEIRYFESFETKSEAQKREVQLKEWKNRKVLEKLISGG